MWSQTKDGCDAWLSSTLQHFKNGARFLPWDPQFFWHYFYIAEGLSGTVFKKDLVRLYERKNNEMMFGYLPKKMKHIWFVKLTCASATLILHPPSVSCQPATARVSPVTHAANQICCSGSFICLCMCRLSRRTKHAPVV